MLKLLLILAFPISLLAQSVGSAHGYMVLDNGQVLTSRGYLPGENLISMFKPDGIFVLPELVDSTGTNYLIGNNGVLYTSDVNGYFYKKPDYLFNKSVSEVGGSFFITKDDSAHIVMTNGIVVEHKDSDDDYFRKAKVIGGIYLITRSDELVVLNPINGSYARFLGAFDESASDVKTIGHNYFIMEDGTLYTIGVTQEGFSVLKAGQSDLYRDVEFAGGNFFFDKKNNVHTVAAEGALNLGVKDREVKVILNKLGKNHSTDVPEHIGGNYFVYEDGEVYMVDDQGFFNYVKTLPFYERIGRTNIIQEN